MNTITTEIMVTSPIDGTTLGSISATSTQELDQKVQRGKLHLYHGALKPFVNALKFSILIESY